MNDIKIEVEEETKEVKQSGGMNELNLIPKDPSQYFSH
jgi:hypothetical protein